MTKGKDKEETFIKKLGKLEEAGKERERSGLDELIGGNDDDSDDLPTTIEEEKVE